MERSSITGSSSISTSSASSPCMGGRGVVVVDSGGGITMIGGPEATVDSSCES